MVNIEKFDSEALLAQHIDRRSKPSHPSNNRKALSVLDDDQRTFPHWVLLNEFKQLVLKNKGDQLFSDSIRSSIPLLIKYFEDDDEVDWQVFSNASTPQDVMAWRIRNSLVKVPRKSEADPGEFFSKEIAFLKALVDLL
jgi:hypothetical protein